MRIDELEAGRELDKLVAEKVMGWNNGLCPGCVSQDAVHEWIHCIDDWRLVCNYCGWEKTRSRKSFGTDVQHEKLIPHYSTDIAIAWQVVEKLLETNEIETFDLQWLHEDADVIPKKSTWSAILIPFDENADWPIGEAETPALAICRAALKAVPK